MVGFYDDGGISRVWDPVGLEYITPDELKLRTALRKAHSEGKVAFDPSTGKFHKIEDIVSKATDISKKFTDWDTYLRDELLRQGYKYINGQWVPPYSWITQADFEEGINRIQQRYLQETGQLEKEYTNLVDLYSQGEAQRKQAFETYEHARSIWESLSPNELYPGMPSPGAPSAVKTALKTGAAVGKAGLNLANYVLDLPITTVVPGLGLLAHGLSPGNVPTVRDILGADIPDSIRKPIVDALTPILREVDKALTYQAPFAPGYMLTKEVAERVGITPSARDIADIAVPREAWEVMIEAIPGIGFGPEVLKAARPVARGITRAIAGAPSREVAIEGTLRIASRTDNLGRPFFEVVDEVGHRSRPLSTIEEAREYARKALDSGVMETAEKPGLLDYAIPTRERGVLSADTQAITQAVLRSMFPETSPYAFHAGIPPLRSNKEFDEAIIKFIKEETNSKKRMKSAQEILGQIQGGLDEVDTSKRNASNKLKSYYGKVKEIADTLGINLRTDEASLGARIADRIENIKEEISAIRTEIKRRSITDEVVRVLKGEKTTALNRLNSAELKEALESIGAEVNPKANKNELLSDLIKKYAERISNDKGIPSDIRRRAQDYLKFIEDRTIAVSPKVNIIQELPKFQYGEVSENLNTIVGDFLKGDHIRLSESIRSIKDKEEKFDKIAGNITRRFLTGKVDPRITRPRMDPEALKYGIKSYLAYLDDRRVLSITSDGRLKLKDGYEVPKLYIDWKERTSPFKRIPRVRDVSLKTAEKPTIVIPQEERQKVIERLAQPDWEFKTEYIYERKGKPLPSNLEYVEKASLTEGIRGITKSLSDELGVDERVVSSVLTEHIEKRNLIANIKEGNITLKLKDPSLGLGPAIEEVISKGVAPSGDTDLKVLESSLTAIEAFIKKPKPSYDDIRNLARALEQGVSPEVKVDQPGPMWFAKEIVALPRTIMASMDWSAVLRQGLIQTIRHPMAASRAFAAMAKSSLHALTENDNLAYAIFDEIGRNYTGLKIAPDEGVGKTLWKGEIRGHPMASIEEIYPSEVVERVPLLGKAAKASRFAFNVYLAKLRDEVFDMTIDTWLRAKGVTQIDDAMRESGYLNYFSPDSEEVMWLIEWLNAATGRGNLGKASPMLPEMAHVLFAPSLFWSRFSSYGMAGRAMAEELVNLAFGATPHKAIPKEVRKIIVQDSLATAGTIFSLLFLGQQAGLIDVEWDVRSSDFGKARIGKTRIDPWAGFQQPLRIAAMLATGKSKTLSGQVIDVDMQEVGEATLRFLGNKVAPVPAMVSELVSSYYAEPGERTLIGTEKIDSLGEALSLVLRYTVPLFIQDLYEAVKYHGPLEGVIVSAPAFFGTGLQTFDHTGLQLNDVVRTLGLTTPPDINGRTQPIQYWWQLDPAEQRRLKAENPEVAAILDKAPKSDFSKTLEEKRQEMDAAHKRFLNSGNIVAYREEISSINRKYGEIFAKYVREAPQNQTDWAIKLSEYFDTLRDLTTQEARDAFDAAFRKTLSKEEQDRLDEILIGSDDEFYANMKKANNLIAKEYWDKREEEFQRIKESSPEDSPIRQYNTYTDLVVAANNRATDNKDALLTKGKVDTVLSNAMETIRKNKPDVDALMYLYGYSTCVKSTIAKTLVEIWKDGLGIPIKGQVRIC